MKKLKNNKGFTLIELLAVIVILAILVAVAVPAVTRYLNTARKGTFASNAQAAISVVRNDVISTSVTGQKSYNLDAINGMLEKKLVDSPYGEPYTKSSYVMVVVDGATTNYYICLVDEAGNGFYNATSNAIAEAKVIEDSVELNKADSAENAEKLCNTTSFVKPSEE